MYDVSALIASFLCRIFVVCQCLFDRLIICILYYDYLRGCSTLSIISPSTFSNWVYSIARRSEVMPRLVRSCGVSVESNPSCHIFSSSAACRYRSIMRNSSLVDGVRHFSTMKHMGNVQGIVRMCPFSICCWFLA